MVAALMQDFNTGRNVNKNNLFSSEGEIISETWSVVRKFGAMGIARTLLTLQFI